MRWRESALSLLFVFLSAATGCGGGSSDAAASGGSGEDAGRGGMSPSGGRTASGGGTGPSGGRTATGGAAGGAGGNPESSGGLGGDVSGAGGSNPADYCGAIETFETGREPTRELFVDSAASGAGDGSEESPFSDLETAIAAATPGTAIRIAPGTYSGGAFISDLRGTAEAPIWIGGTTRPDYPVIEGGGTALQLSGASYVILHDLSVTGQSDNGINVDDGEVLGGTHHIVFRNLEISDVGSGGNQDCLKLSGVDDFFVLDSDFSFCSTGSAIDQVGCHRGVIARNQIHDLDSTGVQAKGGSEDILITMNRFLLAGERAVNLGGSTGFEFFRPPLSDSTPNFEARNIRVIANRFLGAVTPVAFVGCVDCLVANNTIMDPERWVMRILQETTTADGYEFLPASGGRFINNIVHYAPETLSTHVNVGADTAPETFEFSNNLWYTGNDQDDAEPSLPVDETNGIYGEDPLFQNVDWFISGESPAAGAGVPLPELSADASGRCYKDPPSIGACGGGVHPIRRAFGEPTTSGWFFNSPLPDDAR
jgi:hypothetical protein